MAWRVRDTLTGRAAAVRPHGRTALTLYVCGPTVYDAAHVGHGRTYLYFDLVRRLAAARGVPVRHVMNITDFEDKITARASALGIGWRTLAQREERRFLADCRAFGLTAPTRCPRASAFVPQMVTIARRLEQAGRVERRGDEWYYTSSEDAGPNFAVGAALDRAAVPEPGAPPPSADHGSTDFLVWKRQAAPNPSWPSPWGRGVPGWHLECFAMAERYLGLPVDLHGGGLDLVFPHHYAENQIARALLRRPFAHVFLHTAFVTENGRKMSKSVGNLVPLRLALEDVGPAALKWYLLTPPYHQPLPWRATDLEAARGEFDLLRATLREIVAPGAGGSMSAAAVRSAVTRLEADLTDGFRVHDGLDRLRTLAGTAARSADPRVRRGERPEALRWLRRASALLGIPLA